MAIAWPLVRRRWLRYALPTNEGVAGMFNDRKTSSTYGAMAVLVASLLGCGSSAASAGVDASNLTFDSSINDVAVSDGKAVDAATDASASGGVDAAADAKDSVDSAVGSDAVDTSGGADAADAADGADADAGADAGADATPPAAIALADLAAAVAVELCKANFDTCPPEKKIPYATQVGCVAAVAAADAADFAKLAALVAAGKLTFDGQAAAQCLALAAESCSNFELVEGPPVCTKVFVGKSTSGAACGYNVECASDYCYTPTSCAGTCKKRVLLGASCSDKDMCEAGAVCSGGVCVANLLKGAGAACNPLKCKEGLYCANTEKCTSLVKLGGSCDIVGACEPGAQCIDNGAGGVCKPMPQNGEACVPDSLSDVSTQCATGLVCFNDGSPVGICAPKVAIGGACVNSSHCGGWDVHCIGPAGQKTCQLLSGKGGPCQTGDLTQGEWGGCLDPYTCGKGVCIDPPGLGQTCADDILKDCSDQLMCNYITSVCEALPGPGEVCYGLCVTGYDCDLANEPNVCKVATCQ